MDQQIEQKIVERGQEFFNSISGEAPSIFNKGWWTGKVMDWSMKNEDFKVQLFRFLPTFSRSAPSTAPRLLLAVLFLKMEENVQKRHSVFQLP